MYNYKNYCSIYTKSEFVFYKVIVDFMKIKMLILCLVWILSKRIFFQTRNSEYNFLSVIALIPNVNQMQLSIVALSSRDVKNEFYPRHCEVNIPILWQIVNDWKIGNSDFTMKSWSDDHQRLKLRREKGNHLSVTVVSLIAWDVILTSHRLVALLQLFGRKSVIAVKLSHLHML